MLNSRTRFDAAPRSGGCVCAAGADPALQILNDKVRPQIPAAFLDLLRFMPALNLSPEETDTMLAMLEDVLRQVKES